jgi:hypothetical protein
MAASLEETAEGLNQTTMRGRNSNAVLLETAATTTAKSAAREATPAKT